MNATRLSPRTEAMIVGGGPAGAALAIQLARQGRAVELIEQSAAAHHKVCGEFLSREAVAYLEGLGVDLTGLGAERVHGVRLAARKMIAACELPFPALSLSRRVLDEALLALAPRAGATVLRGRRVERLQRGESGWSALVAGGETRCAPTVFLATGKHDLAGHRRPAGKQNDLVAFKIYFRLAPAQQSALRGWVELFLFPGGYAGLQLAEGGQANLCLLVKRSALQPGGNAWPALLDRMCSFSAPLAMRLDGAQPLWPKPLAIASLPYGMLLADAEPGLWRLGDQAAVIPSFSGDGLSIALHSAHLAAQVYAHGGASAEFARRLHTQLRASVRLATALSRLMIAAPALAQALREWPGMMGHLASRTRVPRHALPAEAIRIHQAGAASW
jgi:flavin-dependent dehydrogenase